MSFTGKAAYTAGTNLPELAEDVADLIGIVSPYEVPLLDAIGDPLRETTSTHHEWLEDEPLPNKEARRVRRSNYTQVFTGTVEVSGSDMAASQLGLADEMDFQKQEKLRQLLRDLENVIINGKHVTDAPPTNQPVCRTMNGILSFLQTNVHEATGNALDEAMVTAMLRRIWENSSGNVDLIVVGGYQKRKMGNFTSDRDEIRNYSAIYESDFGICRIVTTRWLPQDAVLFLDSSRVAVLPLAGRSFHYKTLATAGDYECGELTGEYTLELRNEAAHGVIRGLATS